MAITGAAALVGVGATAAGVSATVVAVAGLAITAVGMITGNKVLSKIGGGIGLGGTAAGLYNAATSAASVADAATQAPSVADAAGAGSQAAGNVAESNLAAATGSAADSTSGIVSSAVDSGAASVQTAADAATTGSGAPLGFGGTGSVQSVAPVDSALNTRAATDVNTAINSQSPAQQAIQGSVAGNANAANVNPANVNAANVNPANTASAASTSTPADLMSGYTGASANGGTGLQNPSSWWNSVDQWWNHLSPTGQLAVGQTAAGLVSGVGKGALDMMAAGKQGEATDVQKWEMNNMSGASSVPTVNMKPSGTTTGVYKTPAQIQDAAVQAAQTTTPAFTGLVNKNLRSA